jgi:hypothetical protein
MTTINTKQYESLRTTIFETLMKCKGMGLADIVECYDEAERIVNQWIKTEGVTVID